MIIRFGLLHLRLRMDNSSFFDAKKSREAPCRDNPFKNRSDP